MGYGGLASAIGDALSSIFMTSVQSTAAHDTAVTQQALGNAQLQQAKNLTIKELEQQVGLSRDRDIANLMTQVAQSVIVNQTEVSKKAQLQQQKQLTTYIILGTIGVVIIGTAFVISSNK